MLRTKYQWLARQISPISPVWHSVGGSGTPTVVEEEPRARYQCRYSRVTPTNLQSLELRGVVIQALPELMALAFARGLPSDPASSLPISGLPHRPVVHHAFSKKFRHFAAVSKGKKVKEEKQKGQPHREDSRATTQRKPTRE